MSRRALDIYATERRAEEVAFKVTLWTLRAYWLGRYAVRDLTRRVGWRR